MITTNSPFRSEESINRLKKFSTLFIQRSAYMKENKNNKDERKQYKILEAKKKDTNNNRQIFALKNIYIINKQYIQYCTTYNERLFE